MKTHAFNLGLTALYMNNRKWSIQKSKKRLKIE